MASASASAPSRTIPRTAPAVLVVLAAMAMLFAGGSSPVAASDLSGEIAAARRAQHAYEASMRAHDRRIRDIKKQRAANRVQLKKIRAHAVDLRARQRAVRSQLASMQSRLAEAQEALAGQLGESGALERIATRISTLERTSRRLERTERRLRRQRHAHIHRIRRAAVAIRAVDARRSPVESMLAWYIKQTTGLAQQRASNSTTVRPGLDGSAFTWPSTGRISQGYGCTGFRLAPRRGTCRHFHDGIDIAAPLGTPVRAAAIGVVAYVGWSPHGSGDRAFIIVIGHPGGFETLYAHLLPIERVRVGQLVRKGQAIGRVGNTGRSTGAHLHWEVTRDWVPLDPRSVL